MKNEDLEKFIRDYIKTSHEETKEIWKDMTDEQREWLNWLMLIFKDMRGELNKFKTNEAQIDS